jgi:hypothetical protein
MKEKRLVMQQREPAILSVDAIWGRLKDDARNT